MPLECLFEISADLLLSNQGTLIGPVLPLELFHVLLIPRFSRVCYHFLVRLPFFFLHRRLLYCNLLLWIFISCFVDVVLFWVSKCLVLLPFISDHSFEHPVMTEVFLQREQLFAYFPLVFLPFIAQLFHFLLLFFYPLSFGLFYLLWGLSVAVMPFLDVKPEVLAL